MGSRRGFAEEVRERRMVLQVAQEARHQLGALDEGALHHALLLFAARFTPFTLVFVFTPSAAMFFGFFGLVGFFVPFA